jgi:hypothetical protein
MSVVCVSMCVCVCVGKLCWVKFGPFSNPIPSEERSWCCLDRIDYFYSIRCVIRSLEVANILFCQLLWKDVEQV